MINILKGCAIFVAGAVIGAVAASQAVKTKYENIIDDEIQSVKDMYKKKIKEMQEEIAEEPETQEETVEEQSEELNEYKEIVEKSGYTNYAKYATAEENKKETIADKYDIPYIIDPEEFGEEIGYDTSELTYFADGVLVDDLDEIIDDPDTVVGLENLKVFEEFGANTVYVRNDIWKTDFEIIRDDWNYADVSDGITPAAKEYIDNKKEKKPHQL